MNLNKTEVSRMNAKLASFYLSEGGNNLPHFKTMNPVKMTKIFNDLIPIIQDKHPELAMKVKSAINELQTIKI